MFASNVYSFTPLSGVIKKALEDKGEKLFGSESDCEEVSDLSDSESSEESGDYHIEGEDGSFIWKDKKQLQSMQHIRPWYWNGVRWTEVPQSLGLSRKFCQKEFTIISWNVWFGMRNRGSRMNALGKLIKEYDPDIIALQEVTQDLMDKIRCQKWTHDYFITDPEAKLVEKYGNVLFSKVQFHECILKQLESRMGRKALIGTCVVKQSSQLSIGTFHLESCEENSSFRRKQLEVFKELTEDCSHLILIGDTNFTQPDESSCLTNRMTDVWKYLYQKTNEESNPGLTFDTETNLMLQEEYNSRNMGKKRERLDRCFVSSDTIEPIHMEILGTKPYMGENEYISDHYGILVKFRFKDL
eukprot:TRINITY_DN1204_c0_g1_i1.p1 TRINITY_DN1204_c0_g1~~TRINITY_DN1204_c0_g1_i1.p1  ORF type:complete len:356 (-),score=49.45 TRINITY_DN1204_c0_g1_i1:44-1111(-)